MTAKYFFTCDLCKEEFDYIQRTPPNLISLTDLEGTVLGHFCINCFEWIKHLLNRKSN